MTIEAREDPLVSDQRKVGRPPTNLHVTHESEGIGNEWIKSFSHNDPFSENVILEARGDPYNSGLLHALYDTGHNQTYLIENFRQPITMAAREHEESQAFLQRTIDEFDISHVYVSSLRGHSLPVLDTLIPTTFVHHNFFPFCIAETAIFRSPCVNCGRQELTQCLYGNPTVSSSISIRFWLEFRDQFFNLMEKRNISYIVNSKKIEERLQRLDSRFSKMKFCLASSANSSTGAIDSIYGLRGDEIALTARWLEYLRESASKITPRSLEVV